MSKQKVIVTKICRYCGNPFDIPRWKHHQVFCSTKCKKEAQIIKLDYQKMLSEKPWKSHKVSGSERIKLKKYFKKCIFCGCELKGITHLIKIPPEFSNGSDLIASICDDDYENMKMDEYSYKFFFYEELLKFLHSSEQ